MFSRIILTLILLFAASVTMAQDDTGTRILRYPDLHANQLVFSYAGDLWLAPADGSQPARRLTSHPGLELYPRFSPDGSQVAFTGQYRGDEQVYVIDTAGGKATQLTFYPTQGPLPSRWGTDHQVYDWTPDGQAVLFRSNRQSFNDPLLYRVAVHGGLPEALPMPRAGSGVYSPDGNSIVYSPLFRDFRTWKRYQGGWAQNLYIYDLGAGTARQITKHERTERDPVWLKTGLFYVSDRDGTLELFAHSEDGDTQLTKNDTWDIKWASGDGEQRIVYEVAGRIGLYDTASNQETLLNVQVPDDHVRRTARSIKVGDQMEDFNVSPDGKRALVTARGDVFSVPVEHGITRNLTQRGNAHDREAVWSPDGRQVAFISDRNGEEQLFVTPGNGGEAKALSDAAPTRLYGPLWSPDSKHIAYHDHRGVIHVIDLEGKHRQVFDSPYDTVNDYVWSPDSQWLSFSNQTKSGASALYLWSAASGKVTMATKGFFNADSPSFSHDGKHLFFISNRQFAPQIGSLEWNYVVDRENGVFALALTKDAGNPFSARNDEVSIKEDGEEDKKSKKDSKEDKDGDEDIVNVSIDFDGLAERVIKVPVDEDNIFGVLSLKERLLYVTGGAFYYGRSSDTKTALRSFDPEERKSEVLIEELNEVEISADGQFALISKDDGIYRVELAKPKEPKKIDLGNLIVNRAPAEEWVAIFDEVWRRFRDYFYVDNLHGYDWEALRDRYRPFVADVSTREDLNTLMGEMIAELSVGHAYVQGGDLQAGDRSSASLLGARFELDERSNRYRIAHIYSGQNEESKYRSPLTEVGVDAGVGDYILAIDGQDLDGAVNPYALLTDLGKQPVELLVNDNPDAKGARRVLVEPIGNEGSLVYLEWVQNNLNYVNEQSNGRLGYLHIPDMGSNGIYEFIKWFYPQIRKQGLIVDVRGNGGGNVSQMILRRLMQKPLGFGYRAHSEWVDTYPQTAFNGPMASLISENSASDGDIFPYFFRELGLGPLIGKKTWGGVVGITGHGPLLDGGNVFVPEFGMGQAGKGWVIEGEGVAPDIEVANDPATGADAQLDRGIAEVLERIEANPPVFMPKPAGQDKTR